MVKKISKKLINNFIQKKVQNAQLFSQTFEHLKAIKSYQIAILFESRPDQIKFYMYNIFFLLICVDPSELSIKKYKNYLKRYSKKLIDKSKILNFNFIQTNKKIKVGFICHFFSSPITQNYLWNIFKELDRDKFELFVFSDDHKILDNKILKSKEWLDFKKESYFYDTSKFLENDFVSFVKSKNLNILFECNGHTHYSRFVEMSNRLANIQCTLFNINGPSGFDFIDFFPIYKITETKKIKELFTEKFIEHEGLSSPTKIELYPTIITPIPYYKNNFITFGYFGALHKVSHLMFSFWCDILNNVKNSRIYLKSSSFYDVDVKKKLLVKFFQKGISKDQIILEYASQWLDYLNCYNKVDISFSPYPHTGGSTFVDSLIMGVPLYNLHTDKRFTTQFGKWILHKLNLQELIVNDLNSLKEKYLNLANSPDKIISYKIKLRDHIKKSTWFKENSTKNFEQFLINLSKK
jgi:predicted O-linked N-acetylglucosamine transferase (SPINDLY family)